MRSVESLVSFSNRGNCENGDFFWQKFLNLGKNHFLKKTIILDEIYSEFEIRWRNKF